MPVGTKVDEIFQALKRQGKSVASAARIAQSVTGTALATGKPPKHKVKKKPRNHLTGDGERDGGSNFLTD